MKTINGGQIEHLKDDFELPHKVLVAEENAHWRKKFNTPDSMFVLVRSGFVVIFRDELRLVARPNDVVFVAPGSFRVEGFSESRNGIVHFEYGQFSASLLMRIGCSEPGIEQLALNIPDDDSGFYLESEMLRTSDFLRHTWLEHGVGLEAILTFIINQSPCALFPFLRSAYFKKRWALQALLESHVFHPNPVAYLSSHYIAGRSAFFQDCNAFTDFTPRRWFVTRRMQLARIWIDGGDKPVGEVASALQFTNLRKFTRDYTKHFGCRPGTYESAVMFEMSAKLRGGSSLLRPFWWPFPLPMRVVDRPVSSAASFPEVGFIGQRNKPEAKPNALPKDFNQAKAVEELDPEISKVFWNMEPVEVSKIISFPDTLPELLKAA